MKTTVELPIDFSYQNNQAWQVECLSCGHLADVLESPVQDAYILAKKHLALCPEHRVILHEVTVIFKPRK